jgi:hypothetical protein
VPLNKRESELRLLDDGSTTSRFSCDIGLVTEVEPHSADVIPSDFYLFELFKNI